MVTLGIAGRSFSRLHPGTHRRWRREGMNPDYRLAPGNRVDIYASAADTGYTAKRIAIGEVHVVLDNGARYKVRVLVGAVGTTGVGEFAVVDANLLHQQ